MRLCFVIFIVLFTVLGHSQESSYPIANKGKWGWVNYKGEVVQEPKYEYLSLFKGGVAVYKKDGKYGLVNSKGLELTFMKYSDLNSLSEIGQPLYLVKIENKQGIINNKGIEVVPLKYNKIYYNNNLVFAKRGKVNDVLNLNGDLLFSRKSDSLQLIDHNFFVSYENKQKVLLDDKGNELFRYLNYRIERKQKGNLIVLDQNKLVFFNTSFEKIIDTNLVFVSQNKNLYQFKDNLNNVMYFSFVINRFFENGNILKIEQLGKYFIISNDNRIGVIDTNNNQVVPFKYKNIKPSNNYFFAKSKTDKVALFSNDFKMIVPPKYDNLSVAKFGFIYENNGNVGLLDKKGDKLTEAKFKYVNVNAIPVKCYRPEKGVVQIIFDDSWNYVSKKEFNNYISLSSRQENEFFDFSMNDFKENDSLNLKKKIGKYGWFSDSVEVIKEDSTIVKVEKWGLKNEEGLVVTNPIFKDFTIVNDSISYAYRGKKQTGKSTKRIKDIPVLSSFTVVNHVTGQILRKQSFFSLNFNELKENNLIRGLSRNGICLFDKDFNLIEKEVHYAAFPKDNMMLYSTIDLNKKAPVLKGKMVKKIEVWGSFGSGIDMEKYKSEMYNPNVDYDEKTYFKEYLTKKIKFGFYNTLTNEKSFAPQFDYASDFKQGVSFVGSQKSDKDEIKYGIINKDKIIAPLIYSQVDYFQPLIYDNLYLLTLDNGRAIFIDTLLTIKETNLSQLKRLEKDVIIAKEKNKYGILDDNLNWVMEPSYRRVFVSDNNELISKEKLHGVISKKGINLAPTIFKKKFIIPLKKGSLFFQNKAKTGKVGYYSYQYGELFKPFKGRVYESNWFILKVQENEGAYYRKGELIKTNKLFFYSKIADNEQYVIGKKRKKIKITNKETNESIKKKDLVVVDLAKEGVYYTKDEAKGLMSYMGDTLIKAFKYLDLERIEDSLILSSRKSVKGRTYKYGLLDLKGNLIQPCNYNKIDKVFDTIYFCFRNVGLSLFLTPKGDTLKVVECKSFESTSEGLMIYRTQNEAFFIDSSLSKVFKYKFNDAEPFVQGIATVRTEKGWQILNRAGNLISIPSFQSMKPLAKNTVLAIEKAKKGICNYNGDVIVPVEFESINSISRDVLQVVKEGKVGYITTKGKWLYHPF